MPSGRARTQAAASAAGSLSRSCGRVASAERHRGPRYRASGIGETSWFKRHNLVPLSSDLVRSLLFDDVREQRFQDLVFSNLRSMLKARLIAKRPTNYVDATDLTPENASTGSSLPKITTTKSTRYSSTSRSKSASIAISGAIAWSPKTSCAAWRPN